MARIYEVEEKKEHLDKFKVSGKSKTEYARENNIPEATFRAWIKEEQYELFGTVEMIQEGNETILKKQPKPIIFCDEKIRIELKEGFNKDFLRKVIEVLINDR